MHFNKYLSCKFRNGIYIYIYIYINVDVLAFADDTLIFTKGEVKGLKELMEFLNHYQKISGQRINYGKSALIVSNRMEEEERQIMVQTFGFKIKELLFFVFRSSYIQGSQQKCVL